MDAQAIPRAPQSIRSLCRDSYPDLLFLLSLDWIAHFWHYYRFGLYEDDWYFNTGPYNWSAEVWFDLMWKQIAELVFGRPLEILLLYVNGYIGYALDSVAVLYVIAYAFSALMTALVYLVLRQCFPRHLALLAATFFVLSPLTTVRQFLNTAYKMAPSYVFALAGILAYQRRRLWLAYPLGALTLLTYEWLFLVFLGAPLLDRAEPLLSRRTVRHFVICVAILAAVAGFRSVIGETRVMTELPGPLDLVVSAIRSTALHLVNIPLLFLNGAWLALVEGTGKGLLFGIVAAVWFLWLGWFRHDPGTPPAGTGWLAPQRAIFSGSVLALLGLGLSFIVAPGATLESLKSTGRGTRIFGPAEFGVAIALAGFCSLLWRRWPAKKARIALGAGGLAFIVLLVVFQFVVQRDYIQAWEKQRQMLAQIIEQSPDLHEDSTIIVRMVPRKPRLFQSNGRYLSIGEERMMFHWAPYFLFQLGEPAPDLYLLYRDDWPQDLEATGGGRLRWTAKPLARFFSFQDNPITPGRLILFRESPSGDLTRNTTPVFAAGLELTQPRRKVSRSAWESLDTSRLFQHVFPNGPPTSTR